MGTLNFKFFFFVLAVWSSSSAQPPVSTDRIPEPSESAVDSLSIAIMPFANNTLDYRVAVVLEAWVPSLLEKNGLAVMTAQEIRPILRKHRIRSRGWVGFKDAQMIRNETGADFLLLGSWDVLKNVVNPEIGFSMRVLDLEHMTIVSAVSFGATGEDHLGIFELGRISDLGLIASTGLETAINDLLVDKSYSKPGLSNHGCFKLAIIPLNNYSETIYADNTLANILLSRLIASGYFVLEPGFVRELGLAREVAYRGGVDTASAQVLLDQFGVCQIITGTVEKLDVARGNPSVTVPHVTFGLRVMDPRNGSVYLMREFEGAGDDHERFFKKNRVHSLVDLSGRLLEKFVQDLQAANREDILHGKR